MICSQSQILSGFFAYVWRSPSMMKIVENIVAVHLTESLPLTYHALHLAKSPSMVEIQENGKEEKFSLDLSFIQEIKVLSKKAAAPQG